MHWQVLRWTILCWVISGFLHAQSQDPKTGYYLVEEEPFNPPDSAIIQDLMGKAAMAFMANDMDHKEQYLGNHLGQLTLLWFWKTTDSLCINLLPQFNELLQDLPDHFTFISLADENRTALDLFLNEHEVYFPIIPNASILGEAAYAKDLGYPRLFFIDKLGKIERILPEDFFRSQSDAIEDIRAMILAQIH